MTVQHTMAVRNEMCALVVEKLNGGSLQMITASGGVVANLAFGDPAFGPVVRGAAYSNRIQESDAEIGGLITAARLLDPAGVQVAVCTVTRSGEGGDIELSENNVRRGQTVRVTSVRYEAMP